MSMDSLTLSLLLQADFIVYWTNRNHRKMVKKNLGKTFNDFHYQLILKIYLDWITPEKVLINLEQP